MALTVGETVPDCGSPALLILRANPPQAVVGPESRRDGGDLRRVNPARSVPQPNSPAVTYAADAAPGMMKMEAWVSGRRPLIH